MKLYNLPIKTFDPDNLVEEMKNAKNGTMFVIGENRIEHHEGEDTVELVIATISRVKD